MADIRINANAPGLLVVGAGGDAWPVHPLWLRERCSDAANLDPVTQQRLFNPADLDPNICIIAVSEDGEDRFAVHFSDGACGSFSGAHMVAELHSDSTGFDPAPIGWTAAAARPADIDWHSCTDDAVRFTALHDFLVYGYVVLRGVPSVPGSVLQVARRFGFPRETNFGLLFDVRSVPAASDLAYTSLPLDPHTDNPYRAPVPGIQLLHCLANETPGGLSTLVDGLAIAQALQASDPAAFECLSHIAVRFSYVDAETDLVASAPLIELDASGQFAAIHYSPRLDFVPLLPPADLGQFYAARRLLHGMLKSSEFERRFKLADGDLMMFDNRRLLHGRTGFDPQAGLRHLQGCYIDADGPRSQYRVLRRRLA